MSNKNMNLILEGLKSEKDKKEQNKTEKEFIDAANDKVPALEIIDESDNTDIESLRDELKLCKSDKQVLNLLKKYKVKYQDDSEDYGYLNIHIPIRGSKDIYRIYKKRKEYILQKMTNTKVEYSGVPTFFSTDSYF